MEKDNIEHSYLYKKIDSIEQRLENHVTKIEQRLDQLVSIMSAVATLQERETRNADAIKDIKMSIKDSFEKFDKAVERIHGRLDMINKSMDNDINTYVDASKDLEHQIKDVEAEVAKWKERGVGLWLGISALIVCIQIMGGYILKSVTEEYKVTKGIVLDLTEAQKKTEQELIKLNTKLVTIPPPH